MLKKKGRETDANTTSIHFLPPPFSFPLACIFLLLEGLRLDEALGGLGERLEALLELRQVVVGDRVGELGLLVHLLDERVARLGELLALGAHGVLLAEALDLERVAVWNCF